jgi:GxxExxY protein
MSILLYEQECYKIIGACFEVHNELGCGFLEGVYQDALEMEFTNQGIPFEKEKELIILYKKKEINKKYKADFICYNRVLLELKALNYITADHESQLINYLKATNLRVGFLINFGEKSLNHKRFIL